MTRSEAQGTCHDPECPNEHTGTRHSVTFPPPVRSEAQDTAASSGLLDALKHLHAAVVGSTHPSVVGNPPRVHDEDCSADNCYVLAALAHSTPEPAQPEGPERGNRAGPLLGAQGYWRFDSRCEVTPEGHPVGHDGPGEACEALQPHSHRSEGIKWARWIATSGEAARRFAAGTPEPSLRDALATALHEAGVDCNPLARIGTAKYEVSPEQHDRASKHTENADAIIAALPGLSLSAQPSEPGETA